MNRQDVGDVGGVPADSNLYITRCVCVCVCVFANRHDGGNFTGVAADCEEQSGYKNESNENDSDDHKKHARV
jgi:hypothetical protein